MSVSRKLDDVRHAILTFVELDEDGLIEAWDRHLVFRIDKPERDLWVQLGFEGKPPETWLLMIRNGADPVYELLWRPQAGMPQEQCPVVGISRDRDVTMIAANLDDYLDALLYTGGAIGGGTEEDLETAREEAGREATRLGDKVADELDRDLPDLEALGERWEQGQERFLDAWADAVEGLE
ncbi:MAG TPA: hypothetical protein PKA64_21115 [Myxococcota bacterium]|nr:hypothetical protein [Myxococcota bacterium]